MEEFSYSISHDLRAPLRAMQGYAQALLEDYGARLDDEGTDYLRRIIAASSRMDRLTLDVLTYSKVSREDLRPQRVSLGRLVTDCVRQHIDFRDGGADIAIEHPLPDVLGHEPLIMQVVSNLIGNALKFVAPGTTPRVRIRSNSWRPARRLVFASAPIRTPVPCGCGSRTTASACRRVIRNESGACLNAPIRGEATPARA
jgi:light-regulated signal transduction histidine kinase (bacteriophytochrome)